MSVNGWRQRSRGWSSNGRADTEITGEIRDQSQLYGFRNGPRLGSRPDQRLPDSDDHPREAPG